MLRGWFKGTAVFPPFATYSHGFHATRLRHAVLKSFTGPLAFRFERCHVMEGSSLATTHRYIARDADTKQRVMARV
jgi:hypothetical protein